MVQKDAPENPDETLELENALALERDRRTEAELDLMEMTNRALEFKTALDELKIQCSGHKNRREELRGEVITLLAENQQLKNELEALHKANDLKGAR
jgi:uncharacterized coiled-coil DUF342 family protein